MLIFMEQNVDHGYSENMEGEIMNCPNCGAENPDGNRFCQSCGSDLTAGQNNANAGNRTDANAGSSAVNSGNTGAGDPVPNVTNSADTVYNGNGAGTNYSYSQSNSAPYGQQNGYNYNNPPKAGGDYTAIGIISLCLGFISLIGIQCCYIFPIAAIVLGIIGLVKTKQQKGVAWGLSLAGLICGGLALIVWLIIDIIMAIPTMGASFIV